MSAIRAIVQDQGGLSRAARAGDGLFSMPAPLVVATDANRTLVVADIAQSVISFSGFTAGRTLTTDTAANILAAYPAMDIGDSIALQLGVSVAFAGTFAAGTGVTLKGKAAVPASGAVIVYITKTSATTVDWLAV